MVVPLSRGRDARRIAAALAGTVAGVLVAAVPAQAALTASLSTLTLMATPYSHQARTTSGAATLTVADDAASNLGWNVTLQSSDLVYSGTFGGTAIPAANLSVTSAAAPVIVSGQAVDAGGGPKVPGVSPVGTLDTPRKVLEAMATFGNGTYTQQVGLALLVPGTSAAGTYTATVTTTIGAGP